MAEGGEATSLIYEDKNSLSPGCKRPKLVEPVVFFYGFGFYSFMQLTQIYLKYRMGELYLPSGGHVLLWKKELDVFDDKYENVTMMNWPSNGSLWDYFSAEASSQAAYQSSLFALFRCIPPCFSGIVICSCTDTFGRKFGLLMSAIGGIIHSVIYVIVVTKHLPLQWLYVAEFADGIMGEHLVFLGCSFAYMSDTIVQDSLVLRFLIADSVLFSAAAIGNVVIGVTVELCGFVFSFVMALTAYLVTFSLIVFILPESLHAKQRKPFSILGVTRNFVDGCKAVLCTKTTWKRIPNCLLLIGTFIAMMSFTGVLNLVTIYAQGPPFSMSPSSIGFMIGLLSILCSLIQPVMGKIMKLFMTDEILLVVMSIVSAGVFFMMGMSDGSTELFAGNLSLTVFPHMFILRASDLIHT